MNTFTTLALSNYFRSYIFDMKSLKKSKDYVDYDSFPTEFNESEKIDFFIIQIKIRDEIIEDLSERIQDLLLNGKKFDYHLEGYSNKIHEQDEEIKSLQASSSNSNMHKKRRADLNDKEVQTDAVQWDYDSWIHYYQYYSQYYSNELSTAGTEDKEMKELEEKIGRTSFNDDDDNSLPEASKQSSSTTSTTEHDVTDTNAVHRIEDDSGCLSSPPIQNSEDVDDQWDPSNIKEQVKELSEDITKNLGYVYMEEYGMFYDHTTGYYYDSNSSLYYDSSTGIYFYYDPQTNEYQFHSQVEISPHSPEDGVSKTIAKEHDEIYDDTEFSNKSKSSVKEENCSGTAGAMAPSLRLIVKNGDLKGRLFIVTIMGGSVGRGEGNDVVLDHVSVSNVHCSIWYSSAKPDDHHYFVQDLGSTNGTWLKNKRLISSDQKKDSQEIGHGWDLRVGDITLSCHIHPGHLTCNECEPGLICGKTDHKDSVAANAKLTNLDRERKRQNRIIKKKYSLPCGPNPTSGPLDPNYRDRASLRRTHIGSDAPQAKHQVSSLDSFIPKENKGFRMLEKMGWSEGQSLGVSSETAIKEPIPLVRFAERAGLGSSCEVDVFGGSPRGGTYRKLLTKTQQRFEAAINSKDSAEHCVSSPPLVGREKDGDEVDDFKENGKPKFLPVKFTRASHSDEPS